jgi:MFS family permease
MFTWLAVLWVGLPLIGLIALREPADAAAGAPVPHFRAAGPGRARGLGLVLAFSFLSTTAINISQLGRSFTMQSFDFSPGAVAGTATAGGLFAIPVLLLNGALSDRFGRARFLLLTNALALAATLTLAAAFELWQFWLAAALALIAATTNSAMTSALLADRLAPGELNRALSALNATGALAAMFSFSMTGYGIEWLGAGRYFLLASLLPVGATAVLALSLGWQKRERPAQGRPLLAIKRPPTPELSDSGC